MLFSGKKFKTEWNKIIVTSEIDKHLALVDSYNVLLQNEKKYPYHFETIAVLSEPQIESDRHVSFNLCPKTYNLFKRKKLFSLQHWSLQLSASDMRKVKRAFPKLWVSSLKVQETESGNDVEFFIATDTTDLNEKIRRKRISLIGPYKPSQDILPPWIVAPDYPPADMFWRQPGEAWFFYAWLPYWDSLSEELKRQYLETWNVTDVWRDECPYINTDLQKEYDEIEGDIVPFILNYRKKS